jgi:hypothetical protein
VAGGALFPVAEIGSSHDDTEWLDVGVEINDDKQM